MTTVFRGFRYKLAPTPEQEAQFRQFAGVCRLVYNLALEQRRDWWRQYMRCTGKSLSFASQCRELTQLRAQFDWIREVSITCEQQALRDLDKAYSNFFKGTSSYPQPRRKGENDTFRFPSAYVGFKRLNRKWSAVRLPKIGWVKYRDTRPLAGMVKNVTVSRDALGWHVSFACEIEMDIPANALPSVGIDRGIANTLTLSTGEHLSLPMENLRRNEKRKRRAQRVLSRRKRGSARYAKARRRVAKLSAKAARIRKDWQHKTALFLAQRFGTVVLEDLRIKNMSASARGTVEEPGRNVRQKAGLNRAILEQGWGGFETALGHKLEARGGHLCKVSPAFTSQTCSACGAVDKEARESQAVFQCRACGYRAHADHNAALNILRRNTAWLLVEGGRETPCEARTKGRAKAPT